MPILSLSLTIKLIGRILLNKATKFSKEASPHPPQGGAETGVTTTVHTCRDQPGKSPSEGFPYLSSSSSNIEVSDFKNRNLNESAWSRWAFVRTAIRPIRDGSRGHKHQSSPKETDQCNREDKASSLDRKAAVLERRATHLQKRNPGSGEQVAILERQASTVRQQAAAFRNRQSAVQDPAPSKVHDTLPQQFGGMLQRDIHKEDAVILLMGGVGTGKSSFVQALMGQENETEGETLETHAGKVTPYEVVLADGSRVVVVDTPGFGDTHKSELEILEIIITWLNRLYQDGILLTGIAFFHRISDNRMAGSSLKNFKLLRALSGDEAAQNTVLVTSMWDIVRQELGIQREKDIADHFWKPAIENGARLARFSHTPNSARDIIKMFDRNSRVVMQIQREMTDNGLRLSETQAGSVISSRLAQLEKERLKELEAAREELARARDRGNKEMSDLAVEEFRRLNELRAELEASRRRLQEQETSSSEIFGRFKLDTLRGWYSRLNTHAH